MDETFGEEVEEVKVKVEVVSGSVVGVGTAVGMG